MPCPSSHFFFSVIGTGGSFRHVGRGWATPTARAIFLEKSALEPLLNRKFSWKGPRYLLIEILGLTLGTDYFLYCVHLSKIKCLVPLLFPGWCFTGYWSLSRDGRWKFMILAPASPQTRFVSLMMKTNPHHHADFTHLCFNGLAKTKNYNYRQN